MLAARAVEVAAAAGAAGACRSTPAGFTTLASTPSASSTATSPDPHNNPGLEPIRKGFVNHTLMVEELGRQKVNHGDFYVLRLYNRLDQTNKGEIACATPGEARKWVEAFEQAKQQVLPTSSRPTTLPYHQRPLATGPASPLRRRENAGANGCVVGLCSALTKLKVACDHKFLSVIVLSPKLVLWMVRKHPP